MTPNRLVTIYIFCFALAVGSHAQTKAKQPAASVSSIETIEIGMTADQVIAGLAKAGYTPREVLSGSGVWSVDLKGRSVGEFSVKNGRITAAERLIFPVKESDAIDLAEAIYWLIYDNGAVVKSEDRDWKETTSSATLDTRDTGSRTAGSSHRMIFLDMKNGSQYRITMMRTTDVNYVWVNELAPFIKRQ